MTRIIIFNATVLCLGERDDFFYPGTLEIENDRIVKVYAGTPGDAVLRDPTVTLIDGTDKLVMPGLVDLHFHTSVAKVCIIFQGR
jgi:5-methylthioadenosine/S-adenosylhomocysteine deaminase